jgi:phenylpyruvate tautomerase PptA (4-oxalocrotonate tautomerase family)
MPILDVEIVVRPGEQFDSDLAAELADRSGQIFGSPPGNTWVKVRFIAPENYAENDSQEELFPVFVSILKARLPLAGDLQAEIAQLTGTIAQICDRPQENVHIFYLPPGAGRVAFGGQLLPV